MAPPGDDFDLGDPMKPPREKQTEGGTSHSGEDQGVSSVTLGDPMSPPSRRNRKAPSGSKLPPQPSVGTRDGEIDFAVPEPETVTAG